MTPFKNAEELTKEISKHGNYVKINNEYRMILSYNNFGIKILNLSNQIIEISYDKALNIYNITFSNGNPFGVS